MSGLRKSYGTFEALCGVSLEVRKGEIYGLLGPNGAGKTTLIRILLGLIKPDSGTVSFFGQYSLQNRVEVLSKVGCIIEEPRFYPYLSGVQNLWLASKSYAKPISRSRFNEVIDLVGLHGRERHKVGTYSQGMRQRLGIAQALLHNPELVILDEPTNGLDPVGIVELRKLIMQLRDEHGKTVVISSHILSEIEEMADSMALINKGECVSQGPVSHLLSSDVLSVTLDTDNNELARVMLNALRISVGASGPLSFQANRADLPKLTRMLSDNGVGIYRLEHRKRLEEYFIRMTNA